MAQGELPQGWEETVKRIAKVVAYRRFPGTQLAEDFPDDAVSHVWENQQFYDSESPFEPWVFAVLGNLATDCLRKRRRRRRVDGLTGRYVEEESRADMEAGDDSGEEVDSEDRSWKNDQKRVEARIDVPDHFCERDLEFLATLPARRKIIALAVTGLWNEVPAEVWDTWLRDARIDPPFPPSECCPENLENGVHVNVRLVAEALGQTENTIRQHFYRAKNVLQTLEKLERLKDYAGE